MGNRWPFVGRAREVQAIKRAVTSGAGVVVTGPAGVGKTRLAQEVATRCATGRSPLHAVHITGTEAAARPFGAFAHELPDRLPGADGSANVLRRAAQHLRATHPGDLLLVVDDAHLLDRQSAALVHYLARNSQARVLVTVRAGETVPEAITDLWRSGLLSLLDLEPFDEEQTRAALAAVLAGDVDEETARRLWDASRGNLLYLRELVAGLSLVDRTWRWAKARPLSTTLRDLVSARIGRLTRAERDALELVALGEPFGLDTLLGLAGAEVVTALEDRDLIAVAESGRRRSVRTAHPLYREVVRSRCGRVRTRLRLRSLADAVEACGARRRDDVLRLALWRLESGSPMQPGALLAAAGGAWSSYDIELSIRLLRAALDAGAGPAAAAPLGFLLFHVGRSSEAVTLLESVAALVRTDAERADHLQALAINLSCGLGEYDRARTLLAQAEAETGNRPLEVERSQVAATTAAVVHFFAADAEQTLAAISRARSLHPMALRPEVEADGIEAWCAAYGGRTRHSLEIVAATTARQEEWRDYSGYIRPTLLDARCNAHLFAGELDLAEAAAVEALEVAGHGTGYDLAFTGFSAYRAQALRMRGDAATALRVARDAVGRSAWNTNLPRCLSELAHAAALLGELETARSAIEEAQRRVHRGIANWGLAVAANAPWVLIAQGDVASATRSLLEVARRAVDCELYGYALLALHDVVRVSPVGTAREAARRLTELESSMDGQLVTMAAAHGRAAAAAAAEARLAGSQAFDSAGMPLPGAEAAAQAARVSGRSGPPGVAQVRAWQLAQRCPGVRTPALDRFAAPGLTPRQLEVAQAVAAGLTDRQVATALNVSVRTVENHVAAIYDRLGLRNREALVRLLHQRPPDQAQS